MVQSGCAQARDVQLKFVPSDQASLSAVVLSKEELTVPASAFALASDGSKIHLSWTYVSGEPDDELLAYLEPAHSYWVCDEVKRNNGIRLICGSTPLSGDSYSVNISDRYARHRIEPRYIQTDGSISKMSHTDMYYLVNP